MVRLVGLSAITFPHCNLTSHLPLPVSRLIKVALVPFRWGLLFSPRITTSNPVTNTPPLALPSSCWCSLCSCSSCFFGCCRSLLLTRNIFANLFISPIWRTRFASLSSTCDISRYVAALDFACHVSAHCTSSNLSSSILDGLANLERCCSLCCCCFRFFCAMANLLAASVAKTIAAPTFTAAETAAE